MATSPSCGTSLGTLRRVRPDVVCAVNEELAFLLLPFKGVLFRRLVCELYDPLDARHSGASAPVRIASRIVSAVALRFSDADRHRRKPPAHGAAGTPKAS